MGKNLMQQRRGKGSIFKFPEHYSKGLACYITKSDETKVGKIVELLTSKGHTAPLMRIKYDTEECMLPAPEGVRLGEEVVIGVKTDIKAGNTMEIGNIPGGTFIYNIESKPGDGGIFVRSSGLSAKVIGRVGSEIIVMLPSKKEKRFCDRCRATIGRICGGGRDERPFMKAGNRFYKMSSRHKKYPFMSGCSMNAVDHPFGGKRSLRKGRPTLCGRDDPPGRKVGMIAPSRTGRRKK